jgi:hypothetical protein
VFLFVKTCKNKQKSLRLEKVIGHLLSVLFLPVVRALVDGEDLTDLAPILYPLDLRSPLMKGLNPRYCQRLIARVFGGKIK